MRSKRIFERRIYRKSVRPLFFDIGEITYVWDVEMGGQFNRSWVTNDDTQALDSIYRILVRTGIAAVRQRSSRRL